MPEKKLYPCRDTADGWCPCRCHAIGLSWKPRKQRRPNAYLPVHDEAIRAANTAGDHPEAIARTLTERFGIPRTEGSVRQRMRRLGLSTRDGWWSREDVIRKLGISERKLLSFEAGGLIQDTPFGRWRRYRFDDVEALIRAEAGLTIDPRRIKDARFRSLAETAAIVNRRRASA